MISNDDHARIAQAVAKAEASTSGEIRCVLAYETGNARLNAMIAGLVAALVLPGLAVVFGFQPAAVLDALDGWSAGHGPGPSVALSLGLYAAVQVVVFALVAGVWLIGPLRRLLTPKAVVTARVRAAAIEQFEALGLTHTRDRTGVLLFASLDDHRAEVLADSGIYEKTTSEDWEAVAAVLVAGLAAGKPGDGFVAAVDKAGVLLAAHLPPRPDDSNELPDALVVRKGR